MQILVSGFYLFVHIKMLGIDLAKTIIDDDKEYPKRVGILGIVILIVCLIFLLKRLFAIGGIFECIGFIILLAVSILIFYSISN